MKSNTKSKVTLFATGVLYVISALSSVAMAFLLQRVVDSANTGDVSILVTSIMWVMGLWLTDYIAFMLAVIFRLTYVKEMLLIAKRNRLGFLFALRQNSPAKLITKS